MVNTRDGTMLCINVRMRMRMIGRVGVSVSVRLRSHCGRRNAREKASIEWQLGRELNLRTFHRCRALVDARDESERGVCNHVVAGTGVPF